MHLARPGKSRNRRVEDMAEALRKRIPDSALEFTFSHAGGPGGQNVNKVATRVTLWFDLAGSAALTAEEKRAIRAALSRRIGADGRLRIVSMRHRTQRANRDAAVDRFFELLASALAPRTPRKTTRVSVAARRKRVEGKRRRAAQKRLRGAIRENTE